MTPLKIAFIPLLDAAPLIVAREMGFARDEGLEFELTRAPSWSSLRDMLAFGQVEAAHMLAPVPVAMSLGLGGMASPLSALMVLSLNGTVVGVNAALAETLRGQGFGFDFQDAAAAGAALVEAARATPLRIGVPFPFSMHAELLYYWLNASGLPAPQSVEIRTVPPPLMAQAMAAGEINAFCVGEPWGSKVVEADLGALLLPGSAIWTAAPEKVLAVRTDWATSEPHMTQALMRAVWRACRWLGTPGATTTTSEFLSRGEYLDLSTDIIDRGLQGRLIVLPSGEARTAPGFMEFHAGAANFPWKSQATWIAHQMATRLGLDRVSAMGQARHVFRSDLYRQNLGDIGAILPTASEKVEGGIAAGTDAAAVAERFNLAENRFFDDEVFDPDAKK